MQPQSTIPLGLCQCGCGRFTHRVRRSERGYIKGDFQRFIQGHTALTKPLNMMEQWLWSNVEKTETCWIWTGRVNHNGYGRLFERFAHRLSWEISNGPIPDGLYVLHHCDNPPCVNPEHLFLGTRSDNSADRDRKGRVRYGSDHPYAKLSEETVVLLRNRYTAGNISVAKLAAEYGISFSAAYAAIVRRTWRRVP